MPDTSYLPSLTPAQMQQLLDAHGWGYGGSQSFDGSGAVYSRTGVEHIANGENYTTPAGFVGYASPDDVGKSFATRAEYGNDGGFSQMGQNMDDQSFSSFATTMAALIAAVMTGGASLSAMAAGGAAAGAGGASALGSLTGEGTLASGAAYDAGLAGVGSNVGGASLLGTGAGGAAGTAATGLGGSGAFLGEGMASGVPAWDAAATNAGLSLTAPEVAAAGGTTALGAGAGSGSAMGPPTAATQAASDATLQSQLAPYATDAATTGAASSILPQWVTDLGITPSMLGTGVSLLGGLLGSKGTQSTQTQTHDLPDYLKPYVAGPGGLLDSASKLFAQQTQPGALPGYGQMQTVGQGLLSQPIAGNGFAQFQAMPRFGVPPAR